MDPKHDREVEVNLQRLQRALAYLREATVILPGNCVDVFRDYVWGYPTHEAMMGAMREMRLGDCLEWRHPIGDVVNYYSADGVRLFSCLMPCRVIIGEHCHHFTDPEDADEDGSTLPTLLCITSLPGGQTVVHAAQEDTCLGGACHLAVVRWLQWEEREAGPYRWLFDEVDEDEGPGDLHNLVDEDEGPDDLPDLVDEDDGPDDLPDLVDEDEGPDDLPDDLVAAYRIRELLAIVSLERNTCDA
jgi:hypothetical protein